MYRKSYSNTQNTFKLAAANFPTLETKKLAENSKTPILTTKVVTDKVVTDNIVTDKVITATVTTSDLVNVNIAKENEFDEAMNNTIEQMCKRWDKYAAYYDELNGEGEYSRVYNIYANNLQDEIKDSKKNENNTDYDNDYDYYSS